MGVLNIRVDRLHPYIYIGNKVAPQSEMPMRTAGCVPLNSTIGAC